MKYYFHDSNAFQDEKITELFIKFGYEGIGLFFTILEKLAMQEQPIKTDVLKKQLFIGKRLEKCWNFLEQIELISSNNGETFNKQLLNFAGKYKIKKEKNAKRISEWRKNQSVKENVTCYETVTECVRNTDKVKRSKVNRNKENNINEFNFKNSFLSLGVDENILNDWLKVRKLKKGVDTETAFNSIKKQIDLSKLTPTECIRTAAAKNWVGFEAEWLKTKGSNVQTKLDYAPTSQDIMNNPDRLKFRK